MTLSAEYLLIGSFALIWAGWFFRDGYDHIKHLRAQNNADTGQHTDRLSDLISQVEKEEELFISLFPSLTAESQETLVDLVVHSAVTRVDALDLSPEDSSGYRRYFNSKWMGRKRRMKQRVKGQRIAR